MDTGEKMKGFPTSTKVCMITIGNPHNLEAAINTTPQDRTGRNFPRTAGSNRYDQRGEIAGTEIAELLRSTKQAGIEHFALSARKGDREYLEIRFGTPRSELSPEGMLTDEEVVALADALDGASLESKTIFVNNDRGANVMFAALPESYVKARRVPFALSINDNAVLIAPIS